ncbi:MAG: hypothetical protein HJJLKODD_00412 [Phycisphaerae bacterium]|nr:hypothetical protein [Phycisphaerae bacterium]
MRILVKENNSVVSDRIFRPGPITIGSLPDCAIHLPDLRIANHQALLTPQDDGQWVLANLGGTSRTMLNGSMVRGSVPISNGDQINIQDFTLAVYLEHADPSDKPAAAREVENRRVIPPLPPGAVTKPVKYEIALNQPQIEQLVQWNSQLAECSDLTAIIEQVLTLMMDAFHAHVVWMGIRRSAKGMLEMVQGRDRNQKMVEQPRYPVTLNYNSLDHGLAVWVPKLPPDEEPGSLVMLPLPSRAGRLGLLYVERQGHTGGLRADEFDQLIALGSLIGFHLERVIEKHQQVRQQVAEAQSEVVRVVQAHLELKQLPEWSTLQMAVHTASGYSGGGDCYDVQTAPNGAAVVLLASGRSQQGADVAVALMEMRSAFRIAVVHGDLPHVILQQLQWLLKQDESRVELHAAVVVIDPRTGAMLSARSGGVQALIIGQSGLPRPLLGVEAPLTRQANEELTSRKGILGQEETLALYSPGVANLRDETGQLISQEALVDELAGLYGMAARTALDDWLMDIKPYIQAGCNPEDVTLMLIHRALA